MAEPPVIPEVQEAQPEPPPPGRRFSVHAALVPVPIGFWVASLVFDIASRFVADPAFLSRGSTWLVGIGLIAGILAGIVGFIESIPIPPGTRANRAALIHLGLMMGTAVLYGTDFILRLGPGEEHPVPWAVLALSVVNFVVLVTGGYFGGSVVHRHGYHPGAAGSVPASTS
jgi:uncharacterized membrane protein